MWSRFYKLSSKEKQNRGPVGRGGGRDEEYDEDQREQPEEVEDIQGRYQQQQQQQKSSKSMNYNQKNYSNSNNNNSSFNRELNRSYDVSEMSLNLPDLN
jgi:hypothetical protein